MRPLITNKPSKRVLTPEGEQAFFQAYQSIGSFEAARPVIRFPAEAYAIYREIASLRMKSYRSTTRWNEAADLTGLLGELAAQRYFDIPAETAMADFLDGLQGDRGYDLLWGSERIDCKATKGQALRFKFSKTNRNRDKATTYVFVKLEEVGSETWATILGWSYRHQIGPWVRDNGRSLFVRAETLRREGLLYPISTLKGQEKGSDVTNVQV